MNGVKLESRNWKFEIREEKLCSRSVALPDEFCANFKFPVSIFSFQRSRNACSGVALIGIIIAIIVMGMLGGSVLMLITTGSMESLQTLNWNKAFFAAESGISKAKYQMTTNASWYVSLPRDTGMIGSASFTNLITTNATTTVISSTGVQGDARWTSRWSPAGGEITRALIVYMQSSPAAAARAPCYRTCSNLRRLSNELTANSASTSLRWQRIAANPRTNEFLLVTEDNNRWIYAQTYLNGAWVSNTWLNAAGRLSSAAYRCFDVAYESLSGRGMVVYSVNSATPQYRLWTSNSWSAPVSINVGATNAIQWIRLISKPGTNEIMCLARWQRTASAKYSSAIIWNGTTWTNSIPLERECNSSIACDTMDAAYSANTGLVVYINRPATNQPKYRTYAAGMWSAERTNFASLGSTPYWIRAEYSPDGAQAYAGFLCYISAAQRRLRGTYWNGSSWGSYNTFSNVNPEIVTRRCFDIAWSSQTNTLMVAYSLNQNAQSYLLATGGGSSNRYGNMVSTDDGQWCVLKADPFTSEFYYMALDDASDVNIQRWTGTAWGLFPEPENNSALTYLSIDFAFRRDSASTNCWPVR